ncbi:BTB/POZ domain-containing protein [Xylaria curta]|nr:BTB/POZ domain-containing protein [Xylaria curta]
MPKKLKQRTQHSSISIGLFGKYQSQDATPFQSAHSVNTSPCPPIKEEEASRMVDSNKSLLEGIAKLFNNTNYADVKIQIGQYELPAHSVVLASQSAFFQKALSEKFQEGNAKQFYFKDDSAHAHWRVFEYMYTGNYTQLPVQLLDTHDDDELVKDVRVYVTAEFFMLDNLKQLALGRFRSKLKKLWVSELLFDCIREIYASTTPLEVGLRNAVVEVVAARRNDLWEKVAFQNLLHDGGDFAVDLLGQFCSG